jgi:hypothetical protein
MQNNTKNVKNNTKNARTQKMQKATEKMHVEHKKNALKILISVRGCQDSKHTSLEIFQGPYGESKTETSVL